MPPLIASLWSKNSKDVKAWYFRPCLTLSGALDTFWLHPSHCRNFVLEPSLLIGCIKHIQTILQAIAAEQKKLKKYLSLGMNTLTISNLSLVGFPTLWNYQKMLEMNKWQFRTLKIYNAGQPRVLLWSVSHIRSTPSRLSSLYATQAKQMEAVFTRVGKRSK